MRRKQAGFIAAQAAIFVGVIALVSLPLQFANQSQVSTSSPVAGSLAFTSGVSPQGLQLEVTLNSSSVKSYGAISARVEVLNTLDRNVSLSGLVQNQNILEWSGDDYVCDSPSTIVGFALFQGYFTAGNISAAGQPLQLAPPEVIYGCQGAGGPFQVGAVTFLPEGDQAVATDDFQGIYEGSYPVTVSVNATTGDCVDNPELVGFCTGTGLSGYWNDSIPAPGALNFKSPAFAYFPPGEYTIAATDLWDQYVYATFDVQPADSSQSSPALTASCFVSIPAGAQLGLFANSTFNGNNVTYANGTSFLFSNSSCPRPVSGGSSQGANTYAMAVAAVSNSSFIAAENGSEFLFQEPFGLSCSTIGTQQCGMTLFFYHYGENSTLFRCGGGLDANLASMLYRRDALAGITVTFHTAGQAGPDGVGNSTAWDLQDSMIQVMSAGQVMQYYDSSYPCG